MSGKLDAPEALPPGKQHKGGGRVSPRAGLDTARIRTPAVQPLDRRYTDWAIPALISTVVSNISDRLCGLVVRGPGFDSRRFKIFWEAGSLERGPLSLVRTTEELLGGKSSGFGLANRD
jgi:hypothetical protein